MTRQHLVWISVLAVGAVFLALTFPSLYGQEALGSSMLALKDGKFINFRVPYPMGFYIKGMDGRIDDPDGGWKGKGMWTTWGTRTPFHGEGGKGTRAKVVKFQLRPDPLAR